MCRKYFSWIFWLLGRPLCYRVSTTVTRFCIDPLSFRHRPIFPQPIPAMGHPEIVTAEHYGSASSTSSIGGVGDAAINTRARAPYRIRHRGVFIGLISTIFILCLGNLAVSIFICAIVDPYSTYYDSATMGSYTPGSASSMA